PLAFPNDTAFQRGEVRDGRSHEEQRRDATECGPNRLGPRVVHDDGFDSNGRLLRLRGGLVCRAKPQTGGDGLSHDLAADVAAGAGNENHNSAPSFRVAAQALPEYTPGGK